MSNEMKFEEAIHQLSEIVKALESGEIPLEESIALYEKGMLLSKRCTEILEKAEQKVRFLQEQQTETESNE